MCCLCGLCGVHVCVLLSVREKRGDTSENKKQVERGGENEEREQTGVRFISIVMPSMR